MPAILLVEDNIDLAKVIIRDLQPQGFVLAHVTGGKAALEALAHAHFDALILDWMLPDLDGLEVLRRMQSAGDVTPVLMLTARADEVDRIIGLEVGADDYLTKPFSMRELVACLHALLRRAEKGRQSPVPPLSEEAYHWKGVRVEPQSRRIFVDEQELDLTPMEYALLGLFLRNPGRIFNRPYLMETVWQQPYLPGDRSVDNAILRLRRKIQPYGDEIEAVWGVGYRLRDDR
jgi:DNA-binding response OmpR family regulator